MRQETSWLRVWISGLVGTLLLACSSVASAFETPEHRGAVTDTAGVLTAEDDDYLERRIAHYQAQSGSEVAVLVVPSLEGETIADVAFRTFNEWGIGKKGVDNGVLLVIAIAEHRTRIETGKGIGDKLTDLAAGRILSERLAPMLRAGAFRDGIDDTLVAIEAEIESAQPTTPSRSSAATSNPRNGGARTKSSSLGLAFLLVGSTAALGLVLLLKQRISRSSRRSIRSRGHSNLHSPWVHSDAPPTTASFASFDTSGGFSSSSSSGAGADFGGSSFGGGDFGGGSSGGGGADGSW